MTDARTTLHFIRHGDAVPDDGHAFAGDGGYDGLGLSTKGRAQAAALAERLATAASTPLAVYTSPTLRARETAATVAQALGVEAVLDPRLREIALGDPPLLADIAPAERAAAVRARLDELAHIAVRDGSWAAVPGAEAAASVRERMTAAADAIVRAHPGRHVAIVSHAGSINAYFAGLLGVARDFFFPAGNTSLSTVRFTGARALVVRINDTAHLERLERFP
jgi:broad specificity phosphatase PhoE